MRDFTTKDLYDRALHKLGIRMYLHGLGKNRKRPESVFRGDN